MPARRVVVCLLSLVVFLRWPAVARGQNALSGPAIHITRAIGTITVDGDLSDEAWRTATRIEQWYEVNPGDNVEPKVKNVGYLTYDDRFFYAAFEFEDPNPKEMRAPYADRDNIGNGFNDYGGIILDAGNTGRTATFFVVTPRNIQYDAITDDASGEDSSPDFFWQSATKVFDHRWTLEIRIPFSSLRYRNADPQTWGILLYRNYPRERHYQFFSATLPRGGACFICHSNTLVGLERLPSGGHVVAAPYVSASGEARPRDGLGTALGPDRVNPHAGLDVKFTPNADNVVDLTVKPDFSQVESDTAQISANERFALFFPEKRPFFLEGVDLFQTPIQAVYTRTITAPRWGSRLTGKSGGVRYTALVADDGGGGSVILPGPNGSDFATQEFGSTVFVGRAKRELGLSFVGALVTDREAHDGNGHNRVVGPDFQWRPTGGDAISGQLLYSSTQTPVRADLAAEWTGQTLAGHGVQLNWNHSRTHIDWFATYKDFGDGFRADNGFVPQVGYREGYGYVGWTVRPTGFFTRIRTYLDVDRQADRTGALITHSVTPSVFMETRWNGFLQFRLINDETRAGSRTIPRRQLGYFVQFSPSRRFTQIGVNGTLGEEIDFENARAGNGPTINVSATVNATDHLAFDLLQNQRWLNVDADGNVSRRLFTARVSRVKATYTFTSRLFARGIAQYVSTTRAPALYRDPVTAKSATLNGSALLAYKLNWQSVMFVGFGDDRELSDVDRLEKLDRQFFVKLSYAFQR
jgi:Domain of unknown function (DUF5916)